MLAIFDKGPRVPDSIECIQPGVESPRIEPMPRLRDVPERWLDMDISRRGLSVPRGRKQKEEVLAIKDVLDRKGKYYDPYGRTRKFAGNQWNTCCT